MFPARTHASSTKGWTGHTLGAAGALEAVLTLLSLESGLMPGNSQHTPPRRGLRSADPPATMRKAAVRHAMSNSFGFGGSNCVLLFSAATLR